ncbi:diguanylate cyclase [Paenibacillus sp. CAA11]|uniref:sensor domain-containing diguanylate cyclase n=1 Tax=Paenibacillus sp. CAA11 TaxID=1532905 RepID=UPI000D37FC09|nr:sensor domain-containing diguanylate cyclase [Paenibacillus sp. CAA11]AWB45222.1 diguanylate cyclase [Paenibacillus sp. CAA11]
MKAAQSPKKVSLTVLLSGIVILSFLITIIIAVTASSKSERELLYGRTLEMNRSDAIRTSNTMNMLFKSMRGNLEEITREVADMDPKRDSSLIQERLDLVNKSSNYFNSLSWIGLDGRVLNITPPSVNLVGKQLKTEAVKEALASRRPEISEPYIGTTGRLIVLMTQPIFDSKGNYRGIMGGTLYLQEDNILSSIFGLNHVDQVGSYFYVVDSKGSLIYHPNKDRLGEDVSMNPIVQNLKQNMSGKERVINTKGVAFLAGYHTVDENGWGIVVQTPIRMVSEEQSKQVTEMFLIMLPPFLLFMAIAVWLAQRLAAPFVYLARFVSKASSGQGKMVIPQIKHHWNREADLLTKAVMTTIHKMQQEHAELSDSVMKDPLTGLLNRRALNAKLDDLIENQQSFSLLMMDIDKFKNINDTFGHQAGDEVLQFLADLIGTSIRPQDICYRLGGEELIVLLPDTRLDEAFLMAEQIRKRCESTDSPVRRPITISIGVAEYPALTSDLEELYELADQALYRAKAAGRNRTIKAGTR